ncbi:MAG: hypothetical protein JWP03_1144 [Phycisphaerales bacterium]|nr:hypothetical protein [Phycisphaerales bacterium]
MYYLIKKNQKKLLAIFAAGLMIVFILPAGLKNGSSAREHGRPIGQLGKTIVYTEDREQARSDWKLLSQYPAFIPEINPRGAVPYTLHLGESLFDQIQKHNELFFLLQKEAEQRGIRVSKDEVGNILKNEYPFSAMGGDTEQLHLAMTHFLMVKGLRDRLNSDIKISEPIWTHNLAGSQQVRLNLVEFNTRDLKASLPAPTTQQVEDLYAKYKGVEPEAGMTPADDPLGFGYQVPNRVKLQYVSITRAQILAAVRAAKPEYDWDVQARQYYYGHQQDFVRPAPATQPATAPATQPSTTQPSTQASAAGTQPSTAPATQASAGPTPAVPATPTTRPYAEVKEEILAIAMKADADKLQKDVADALQKRLAADYAEHRKTNPTTRPTTGPAVAGPTTQPSTQPTGYASYGYLEQVAQDIQKQFHVLPEVHQIGEWADTRQLGREPGIGFARAGERRFSEYATQDAVPFVTDPARKSDSLLQVLQPSEQLSDFSENAYVFRLTDASPAHPADLAEVRARVESDAQAKAAYDAALAAAKKLADSARKDGLLKAAVADHRVVVSTGAFSFDQRMPKIPNFEADFMSTAALTDKAHSLLSDATPANPHPVAVVEMPADKKVVVAELADVTLDIPSDRLALMKIRTIANEQQQGSEMLAQSWFNYDAVVKRLDYKSEEPADKNSGS